MGCVASKGELGGDPSPKIYRVWNVDDAGNVLSSGHLELTIAELILHQRGREAIRWPTRCLRRYGFDAEVFSFESGRRCSTGPGVYAFKCRRADKIFNQLQEQIQASGQEEQSHNSGGQRPSLVSEGYLEPTPGTVKRRGSIRLPLTFPNSLSSSSTGLPSPGFHAGSSHYANEELLTDRVTSPQHDYINSVALEGEANFVCNGSEDNYAKLDDLLKQERLYINVKPEEQREHIITRHANFHPQPNCRIFRQMNYAVLDLDKNGCELGGTSPTSPLSLNSLPESSERCSGEGYVTIDFERTVALSCTSAVSGKDESQRKTRHNSNVSNILVSRHNSVVS